LHRCLFEFAVTMHGRITRVVQGLTQWHRQWNDRRDLWRSTAFFSIGSAVILLYTLKVIDRSQQEVSMH
jgi:hypothetical protein